MNRIAEEIEHDGVYRSIINAQRAAPERTGADAVAIAARNMSETLDLKALVAWTASGATALRVARERPSAPILALTPSRCTARRLTAVWGVESVVTKDADDVGDMANRACKFAVRQHFASPGDRILIIAGVPFGTPGATNMVRLAFIGAPPTGFTRNRGGRRWRRLRVLQPESWLASRRKKAMPSAICPMSIYSSGWCAWSMLPGPQITAGRPPNWNCPASVA